MFCHGTGMVTKAPTCFCIVRIHYCSHCCDNTPNKWTEKGKILLWFTVWQYNQFTVVGRHSYNTAHPWLVSKGRQTLVLSLPSPFNSRQGTTIMVGLPSSVKPSGTWSDTCRCISMVIINPATLLMKMDHHTQAVYCLLSTVDRDASFL